MSVAMLVGGGITAYAVGPAELPEEQPRTTGTDGTDTRVLDVDAAAFTNAQVGDCLTWDIADDGTVSNFVVVGCEENHRAEVADRVDLEDVESWIGYFGEDASEPGTESLVQLRDWVCHDPVVEYLDGGFDPSGRLVVTPILPPSISWADGDRTMLCGIQATDPGGAPAEVVGRAADIDQANVVEPGECVALDDSGGLIPVDCAEPHLLEAVGLVDLNEQFPDGAPTVQAQNDFLDNVCVSAAQDYLGGEEALYQSTLLPFWMTIAPESFTAGTRSVNCWVMKDNGVGGFSTLTGSATGDFLIDGAPPAEPPPRNPLREDGQATAPDAGAPTGSAGAPGTN